MNVYKKIRLFKLSLRRHRFKKHYTLNNKTSLISSNCLGGILYHDSSSKFYSPTINLTFDPPGFIKFCENLNYLEQSELSEINLNKPYPCGLLKLGQESIVIYFVHYKNFREAKNKFYSRIKRINYRKIVVLLTVINLTVDLYNDFCKLKYDKLCFYTSNEKELDDKLVGFSNFVKVSNKHTKKDLLSFKSLLSTKLVIEKTNFDFYLNTKIGIKSSS